MTRIVTITYRPRRPPHRKPPLVLHVPVIVMGADQTKIIRKRAALATTNALRALASPNVPEEVRAEAVRLAPRLSGRVRCGCQGI
jgi:hypothetical protein